jgi:8-oxo-dGTP diphosphatase
MKDTPFVAVDSIIFGFDQKEECLKILLIKSESVTGKPTWSLVSGFLETDETIDDSANRVLHALTGITNIYMEQLQVLGAIEQSPEPRTISVSYYALIDMNSQPITSNYNAHWIRLKDKPKLVFDHDKMVEKAIKRLQRRAKSQPIGFKLLPEKFTMRQIQKLYEEILNEELDKRNFAKRINQLGIINRLNEKEKITSRRGSFLFEFDPKKYNEAVEQGVAMKFR